MLDSYLLLLYDEIYNIIMGEGDYNPEKQKNTEITSADGGKYPEFLIDSRREYDIPVLPKNKPLINSTENFTQNSEPKRKPGEVRQVGLDKMIKRGLAMFLVTVGGLFGGNHLSQNSQAESSPNNTVPIGTIANNETSQSSNFNTGDPRDRFVIPGKEPSPEAIQKLVSSYNEHQKNNPQQSPLEFLNQPLKDASQAIGEHLKKDNIAAQMSQKVQEQVEFTKARDLASGGKIQYTEVHIPTKK